MLKFLQKLFSFLLSKFLIIELPILICFFLRGQEEAKANFRTDLPYFICFLTAKMLVISNLHILIGFGSSDHLSLH
jgi:hypothetical protein